MAAMRLLAAGAAAAALFEAPEAWTASSAACQSEAEEISLLQHQRRHGVSVAATQEQDGIVCSIYEVCQCESGPDESSTTCVPGTCRFDDASFGVQQLCWFSTARCKDWRDWPSWTNCHWANFHNAAGKFPGDNSILMALPNKNLSSEVLSGLTRVTIFSDMDDTLTCSGGGIAGEDTACAGTEKHKLYPGVAEFMFELTQGPSHNLPPQRVVPLSARPRELQQVLRIKENSSENKAFKKVGGKAWGFDLDHACYGKLKDGMDAAADMLGNTGLTPFRRMGYTKFESWSKAVSGDSWDGGSSVFVGDDGQGDLVAAQMMLKSGKLLAAFIHDVRGKCRGEVCRATWAAYGIFIFTDYADAAANALAHGFISKKGCLRVCQGAEGLACPC